MTVTPQRMYLMTLDQDRPDEVAEAVTASGGHVALIRSETDNHPAQVGFRITGDDAARLIVSAVYDYLGRNYVDTLSTGLGIHKRIVSM